jgi:hypothetical protein
MARFAFRYETPYRLAGLPFGVTSATTMVDVTADEFRVRFGPWLLRHPAITVTVERPEELCALLQEPSTS